MQDNPILNIVKIGLEDIQKFFDIEKNLYKEYIENEVLKNQNLINLLQIRNDNFNWQKETPLGGAGTSLNACVLYCLIRNSNAADVIETGVSGGYYTSFMLEALQLSVQKRQPKLTSLELSDDMTKVGKLVPKEFKEDVIKSGYWELIAGKSSLDYLTSQTRNAKLFSHDSLHTMAHMMKELNEFKKCELDEFFVFIDDEKSDNFWDRCLQMNAFKKSGYKVQYISGKESRLHGHLGGFLRYGKI